MNILNLEQQQSKELDTPPGVRLADNKAKGYAKDRTTWPVRRLNKVEYNLQQVASLAWLHNYREILWANSNSIPPT